MKKICEDCNPRYCPYETRGTKDYCVRVKDYEKGYADAVEKACDVLKTILENFLHGGDSDTVLALFQEKMEEEE